MASISFVMGFVDGKKKIRFKKAYSTLDIFSEVVTKDIARQAALKPFESNTLLQSSHSRERASIERERERERDD